MKQREIKFRVWDGIEMIRLFDPAIAIIGNSFNIVFTNNFYDLWHSKDKIDRREIKEREVMQFTGLKDKNQNEIYEGDIISHEGDKAMTVAIGEYEAGKDSEPIAFICVGVHVIFHDAGTYSLTQEGKGYSISANECIILGNIYENPELLK